MFLELELEGDTSEEDLEAKQSRQMYDKVLFDRSAQPFLIFLITIMSQDERTFGEIASLSESFWSDTLISSTNDRSEYSARKGCTGRVSNKEATAS